MEGSNRWVLQSPERDIIECAVRLQFLMTNNEAEYKAILTGLNLAKTVGASLVVLHSNSQVVIGNINGNYEAKGEQMKKYLDLIRRWDKSNLCGKILTSPERRK